MSDTPTNEVVLKIVIPGWAAKTVSLGGTVFGWTGKLVGFGYKSVKSATPFVAYTALFLALAGNPSGCHLPTIPWFKPNPTPTPTPKVQPLRVLIVEESADRSKLPESQLQILTPSEVVSKALDANCLNGSRGWKIYDKDVPLDKEDPVWQNAMAKVKAKNPPLPYLAIGGQDGKTLYEGPLPKTPDEMIALLKKFGGK